MAKYSSKRLKLEHKCQILWWITLRLCHLDRLFSSRPKPIKWPYHCHLCKDCKNHGIIMITQNKDSSIKMLKRLGHLYDNTPIRPWQRFSVTKAQEKSTEWGKLPITLEAKMNSCNYRAKRCHSSNKSKLISQGNSQYRRCLIMNCRNMKPLRQIRVCQQR